MKIFIGSARESEEAMRWVALCIEEFGHNPLPWDTPGLFAPGEQTFLKLIDISKTVDAAVFIFSEDDHVWYRGDAAKQPRDNVLIEYGVFAGQLGPRKSIICIDGRPKASSDLLGLMCLDISENRRQQARVELKLWVNKLTSEPLDPSTLRLLATVKEREVELEETRRRLEFESEKAKELGDILTEQGLIDFQRYDLSKDGYWKLMFDYRYFWDLSTELATIYGTPRRWKETLMGQGAAAVANSISRDTFLNDSVRTGFVVRKSFRIFRQERRAALLCDFLAKLDHPARRIVDNLTSDALSRKTLQN